MAGSASSGQRVTTPHGRPIHLALAVTALALGALAATSGDAMSRAAAFPRGDVTALELARWIRDARPGLRVVDLRDAESFKGFSIPGAEQMSIDGLAGVRWEPDANVVVYADSLAAALRAREVLKGAGVRNAWVLRGGVAEWVNTIASPVLPANPSPAQAEASREIAEMSRWFGGVPRVGGSPAAPGDSLRAALGRIRRRGC